MTQNHQTTRRSFLVGSAAGAATLMLPGRFALAAAETGKRLIVLNLRGGLDGLALFPPHGDKHYRKQRGALALPPASRSGIIDLDGFVGLHPSASALLPFWARDEMIVLSAVASPYEGREHEAGQAVLNSGLASSPDGPWSGWMARAADTMGKAETLAGATAVPDMLKGSANTTRLPQDAYLNDPGFFVRLRTLYKSNPAMMGALSHIMDRKEARHRDNVPPAWDLRPICHHVASALKQDNGPRLAAIECDGWDMPQDQDGVTGPLARRFAALGDGIATLAQVLDRHWDNTIVLVVSEFGRSVKPNDRLGTDTGRAYTTCMVGGAVAGSRVVGGWPGLADAQLTDSGGLAPTTGMRAVLKGLLADHLGIGAKALNTVVFPDSANAPAISGLVRR